MRGPALTRLRGHSFWRLRWDSYEIGRCDNVLFFPFFVFRRGGAGEGVRYGVTLAGGYGIKSVGEEKSRRWVGNGDGESDVV